MPARSQRESGKAATKQTTKTPNHAKPTPHSFPTPRSGFVQQDHWTERGRAASVDNSDATGRPRRSVLAFGVIAYHL